MTALDGFIRYVCARQAATDNRNSGTPPPWSADPIIRDYRFCSVIRDEDRTSREAKQTIDGLPENQRLGAALTFRLYNRTETLTALRDAGVLEGRSSDEIRTLLEKLDVVFNTAFKINVGGKLFNKPAVARGIHIGLRAVRNGDFVPRRSAQITTQAIMGTLGVGPFTAYQIMQDVRWIHGPYEDEMSWCLVGDGAVRGLRRLQGTYVPMSFKEGRKVPWKKWEDLRIDREFSSILPQLLEALRASHLSSHERINMFEVEHNCCEYDKAERTRAGEWKGSRFRPKSDAGRNHLPRKQSTQRPPKVVSPASQGSTENKSEPTNSIYDAALKIAQRGRPVFPCDPRNKKPLTKHGFKDATTDPAIIRDWWKRWPRAMVGVPTGERSGVWAVDPDVPKEPDKPDGMIAWKQLVETNGGIPQTRTHATPRGGQHVLFQWHPERPVTNSRGDLPAGIDVRGQGGYIVVPPSCMSDGRAYTVFCKEEAAEAPGWLYDIILARRVPKADHDSDPPPDRIIQRAQRNGCGSVSTDPADQLSPADPEKIKAALAAIPSEDYNTWFEVGSALRRELGDAGLPLFHEWSRKSAKYDQDEVSKKWLKLGDRFTAGTIFHHADQADPGWHAAYETRSAPATPKPATKSSGKAPQPLAAVLKSAADLQTKTFDPLRWIVPKYLPEGLSALAGKPKVGKSWMALDIAIAVAAGSGCLGETCEQGDVLGLFLEDNDRRLQRRITTMIGAQKDPWPARLQYATDWPRLGQGGLDQMRKWIASVAKARLIIVDVLQRVRDKAHPKSQQSMYGQDYDALAQLQALATEAQLSILVLHHQRKLQADDLIDTVSGTLGLGGACDAVLILGTDRGRKDEEDTNFLYGRGRDLEEFNVVVEHDERCRWQVLGCRPEMQVSAERQRIVSVLARAGRPLSVEDIAAAADGKKDNVKALLSKMHRDGDIARVATGIYKLVDQQAQLGFNAEVM